MSLASPQPASNHAFSEERLPSVRPVQRPELKELATLREVVSPHRDYQRGLLSIHTQLMGGVPIDLYEPQHREQIASELAHVSAKPCFEVGMSPSDLKRELRQSLFDWYLAWLDSDDREYSQSTYDQGLRATLDKRRDQFAGYSQSTKDGTKRVPGTVAKALPFPEWISNDPELLGDLATRRRFRRELIPFQDPDGKGDGFEMLYEKMLRVSFTVSVNKETADFPFSSLRDFVLSVLPGKIPMNRPTLRHRAPLPRYKYDLYSFDTPEELHYHPIQVLAHADPDLVVRLVKQFGKSTQDILRLLNEFQPAESLEKRGSTRVETLDEWSDSVREVEKVRRRLDANLPGVLAHLKGDSSIGPSVIKELNSMPPFERIELDAWGELNGLSTNELDELYRFVMGEYPKDTAVLESAVTRLVRSGASFVDPGDSIRLCPALITEKSQSVDPWTKKLIASVKNSPRGNHQILLFEAENRHQKSIEKAHLLLTAKSPMKRGSKEFSELAKICSELSKEEDPELSLTYFQGLIGEVWGDLEGLRSYVSGLVDTKTKGLPILKEDGRFSALMAIQRGFLDTVWRCASNGAERVQKDDLKMSTSIASDLQNFICSHVGERGFPPEDQDIQYLAVSNDLMLLVLTEAHYYSSEPGQLKGAIENHKKCVGATSGHPLANEIKQNPTFLYAASKYAYLIGKHMASLAFVEAVTELDSFVGYYLDLLTRLNSTEIADNMRPDKLGLNGFAPVMVREDRFMKELARMGFLALGELPEMDKNADRVQKMHALLSRLQGKLTPSQALNSHLSQAQRARNKMKFRLADHYIEQSWQSIECIEDEKGFQVRRIEHNEAEIKDARLAAAEGLTAIEKHQRAGEILVMERNLHLEERLAVGGVQKPMRIWEYDASYLQALIRFDIHRVPDTDLPTVERRKKPPFAFKDFGEKSTTEWVNESSRLAQESLRTLAQKSLNNAQLAGDEILEWLKTNLPLVQDPEIQKLPLVSEWEALVSELRLKRS